ncbi:hypothetical protein SXCC_04417 [Gluconacetobacter sp. SXCC-1]|nr:hypothetical protein SXCC_04417 [Gluconacetobacter sp. SXCC-1]
MARSLYIKWTTPPDKGIKKHITLGNLPLCRRHRPHAGFYTAGLCAVFAATGRNCGKPPAPQVTA